MAIKPNMPVLSILVMMACLRGLQASDNDPWFDVTDAEVLRLDRFRGHGQANPQFYSGPFDYTWFAEDQLNAPNLLQTNMKTNTTIISLLSRLSDGKRVMYLPSGAVVGLTKVFTRCPAHFPICNTLANEDCRKLGFTSMIDGTLAPQDLAFMPTVLAEVAGSNAIDAIQRTAPNGSAIYFWCVNGNCDPSVATKPLDIPGMNTSIPPSVEGTAYFKPGLVLYGPRTHAPAFHALCYTKPDSQGVTEVELKFASNEATEGIASRASYYPLELGVNVGQTDYFLATIRPFMMITTLLRNVIRLPRLPRLKRALISFRHICGTDTNGPYFSNFVLCQLRLQLAKADHPDGFEHDVAFVPDSDLFNDGGVKLISNWKSAIFSIPPTLNTNHRAQVLANYGAYVGFAALDDIKITTREMCSPMWVKFPGFGFQSDILSKVDTSLDDFETTGIDAQMLLEKYAMISSTATLEACTRRCYFGSGCDMVEIDPITLTCRFYPHLRLKNEPWFTIVQDNAPTDLYVLQCSTSQENILYNNDFWTTINAPWQIDHNCSKAELGLDSALNEEIGSQTSNAMGTWDFECNTNQGFEVRATLDLDLFPLGIDQPYLNSVNMAGLVVGWAQGLSNPINVNQGFECKLDIEDGNPIVINQMESTTQWPLSKSLTSVSNQLSKTVSLGYLSQYPAQQSRVAPINFLVDMPFGLGCFDMTQEALSTFGAPILAPDMTPVQCLTTCATTFPSPQKRFSGLSNGNECRCFEELPNPDLTLLPDLACSTPCIGDDHQFCGGNTTNVLNFFVGRCPENQQRFGDYCYLQNNQDLSIEENADFCSEQEMHLFWPNSIAEILFLSEIMPKAQRHLGFMYVLDNDGIVAVDGSILVGNGATHLPLDGSPIISPSDDYQMTNISCHILDQDNRVRSLSPCTLLTGALCKAKIAKGAGSEYLGSNLHVDVYSPIQTAPQESFGLGLPIRIELQESAYIQNKWMDLKFPHKIVLKALQIETLKAKFLKSFHLKVAEASFAQSTEFTYIEFKTGKPVLFHVFHTSSENMNNVMQRTIHLVRPRMTRHIQLELVESALEVAINLDIIGMPAKKAYAANKYLEQDYEVHRIVPGIDLNQPGYDIDPNTPLYPNGRLFYRGWINDMSLSKDLLRLELLTPSTKYFNVLVSAEDSVYTLLITSNLITNPPSGSVEWQNYRPSQTLAFEIEVQFSPDGLDLFFKGDLIDTFLFNSDFLNEPIFSRMTQETNGTTSRIQFTSFLQYGAFDEFKMSTNVDFPSVFDPPTLTPLDIVVDKDEGLLFQLFGDPSGKNFGYIPFEFKQNCFETPNGNVKCVPGSGIMSTQSFGGSPGVNNPTVCPTGYDHLGKICMKTFTTLPTHNHGDAQSYCSPDHIYVPMDQDHNRLFRAAMKSMEATLPVPEIWIGLTRFANGSWITDEGIELSPSISDWAPGYPNELDGQANCVMASNVHGFKWINGACNQLKTVYCSYAEKLPYCPRGYEWFPESPDSCFRISSAANHLIAPDSYSSSIHIAEDMCQMEHTRLYVVDSLEQGRALALWVANSPRVSSTYSTIWSGMHEAELGAYIFADQYEPSTSLSEDPAFFAEGGADRSCLRMIFSSGDPSQIGRVHAQECASISNQKFYGVCQYTQCIAQSGDLCQFPFRYQNRLYDSCITLGSLNGSPWCSGSTDEQFNHLPGSELQCPQTCKVNHCPIGYRRMYKDQSCYKLSPPYPSKTKSSVDEAQAECNRDGAKLLEPRSEDFWTHFLKLESHSFLMGQHFKHNAEPSFVALGLFIDFSTGTPVVQYADGTVPSEPLEGTAIPWRTGFPENDPSKACVALMSPDGKLINTPCQGYSDGDIIGHGTLGYLCEARPTEAVSEDGAVKVCHFPFGFNNATYHGCVGPDVAAPESAAQPWCATKVDENGLMVPGKWAFCSDERSIAYSQLDGHYCSVPFLMNKRYYETCTRQTLDPSIRMEHYWCASKLDTSLTETDMTGLKGKCSDYLIPQDEGCQDHFHLAGNKCVRISTVLVTFDEAHNACLDEGAELLTIEDGQISKDLQILLQSKRQKYLHYFQTSVFWVGAEYQNGWKWINSRTNQLKPFGPYTNWKTNMPDLGCPPTMGCSNISRIYVDAESGFTWKAAQREELIGYICQSRCTPPYKWSKNLNSCIYVAISNKTIPEAIVDCAKTNATLYAFRNCAELELLRLDMLDAGVPRNANYAIGMFRGLQNSWNSRNPTKAKFQNSLGYSLDGVDLSNDQALCLAKDDNDKFHLRVPIAFGLHLNEAKLSTYHENLNDPNTRLQKHHYVCQMDDNFACPKDYHKYSDTCLKIAHDAELDMMEAKKACREEKGVILAIAANSLDVQVITEFIKQNQSHENTSQYWMKAQFEPSSRPTYSSFFDPLIRCNCSESTVDFYKHDDQCYYKEWTPMGFAEANSSCANHNGSLATGLDQRSLQMIFRYEELNKNKSGMWIGVNRQLDKCAAGSADCPYHWTDLFNTPINSSRLRISKNQKHLPCLRIMGRGLLETDCSAQYESLCVRNDACPPDVYPGRTNCTLLELYGPNHRILKSQCAKKAGFVCQRNQIQSDFSREKAIGKQLVLPLTKEVGLQDQSGKGVVVNGTNIGFSTRWIKSFQMGSALFGGKSYLDLARGLEDGKGFSIFFTIELWELTHIATIMDFRDPNNETNGLLIELRNGSPVFILRNNQGPQEFQPIDSSRMTEPNKFASYGITYDSVTKRGTIYMDQTYGFQNGSTELSGNYFHFDAEDWFVTALRHPGRLGSSRIDPSSQGLQGGLSCVQIYNTALSPGQVLEMDHCAEKHEKCSPGQIHWDDACFKMSHRKASFAQAEVKCNTKGETGYKSQLIHSMKPDLLDYLSRILKENTGESSFWVGLDSRAGLGYHESADGISIYNASGSLWTESSSTFGNCAKVPESNGGRLDTDDCEADYYYFCQQRGRHLVPDDPCPEGFTFYRGSCLLPSRETMTFENAQEYCGIRGATVYAAKTKAQLEFAREYANMNIKRDIWMGVQIGLKQHYVDPDMFVPLRVMENDDKFYADGMVFDETTDFNFNIVSSSGHWNGPCVFLRASYGYMARNTKCTQEFGFFCEWRVPQCPEDYTLAPELGPRSCYKTFSHPGPYGSDSCHDSADDLRKLTWPRSTKALESFRSRTRMTSGSIWLGAELSDNQTWMDGRGEILDMPGALQDLREDGFWYHDPPSNQTSGCLKMDANGLLQTVFGSACQNESHPYACEYKACYTTQGKQCVFPFSYRNVSASGEVTDLEYTKCSTLDVFLPWCATEVDDAKHVLDWGFCVPDCPSEVVEVACLSEPDFPVFVTPWDASDLVNFTTSYDQGSAIVTKELDFVSFQCPEGFVFEGSNNITHYAMCHNWEYQYLFDKTARCERVACPCPPRFSKDSVVSGTTDWGIRFWTCLENETFPQDTPITYTCPEGYVFETPQLLTFGQETSELFVKCETYADWNVTRKPKCVPINCTDDPPSVPRNDKGNYTWDSVTKTYLHQITYICPSLFWGYPSTGENSTTIHCMANKHWNRSAIEDCKKLPCPRAPPKAPEGGWLWFGMDQTQYQCPNGYEFQGGSGPYMVTECAANGEWRPPVIRKCVPRSCPHPPPLHFMNMEMKWPAQSSQLGVQVTYECPYKKLSTNYQSVQSSTCIWSNDDDNMIWFPNEIEECLRK